MISMILLSIVQHYTLKIKISKIDSVHLMKLYLGNKAITKSQYNEGGEAEHNVDTHAPVIYDKAVNKTNKVIRHDILLNHFELGQDVRSDPF